MVIVMLVASRSTVICFDQAFRPFARASMVWLPGSTGAGTPHAARRTET
jgi:hypothetical protein